MTARAAPAVAIALVAGVLGAIQPKLNATLGTRIGSALVASLINFGLALVCVAIALAVRPSTRHMLASIGRWAVPRWTFTAGLGGALVVLAGALTVETIGVAIFSVAFFAGQLSFGLAVDRLGLAPGGKRPLTTVRLLSIGLALTAVVVAQLGKQVGDFAPALVAVVVTSGAGVAFQSAFNGRIAAATGDPVAATALNVSVGLTALSTVVASLALAGRLEVAGWPSEPWLYSGGALGVTVVLSLAVATAALGVLRTTLSMLAAQMITALVVDWLVQRDPPTLGVFAGGILILAAAALVGRTGVALPRFGRPE